VFVRLAPGVPLLSQGYGGAFAVKKQLARELTLALVLGDHDRKLDNFLVDREGHLVSIDHGMTDPAGRRWGDGGERVSTEQIVGYWKEGVFRDERWNNQHLKPLDELLSEDVMLETVQQMRPIIGDPKALKALVESVYSGEEAEAAMRVLPRRLEALEGFIRDNFGRGARTAPSVPAASARVVPFRAPVRDVHARPALIEELAWAA
jgi:hypothetical protein